MFELHKSVMGRGLDRVVSPSTKNFSFAACEPFFGGYAKHSMNVSMPPNY
jgi:hypothetical protein